jgi:transcriptional regulator with XRE-family HTH domain
MTDIGFGARLFQARMNLAARRGRSVSQVEVGKELGVTGVAVGSWESGEKEPGKLEMVARLAAFLGVRPGWLAFGENGHEGERGATPPLRAPGPSAEREPKPLPKGTPARKARPA